MFSFIYRDDNELESRFGFFKKYIIKAVKMFTNKTDFFINRSLTLFFECFVETDFVDLTFVSLTVAQSVCETDCLSMLFCHEACLKNIKTPSERH